MATSRQHRSFGPAKCEAVTAGEVKYAVGTLAVAHLLDLRRAAPGLAVAPGTLSGELCAPAALPDCCSALTAVTDTSGAVVNPALRFPQ
ncbi:hypothetical protein LNQ03_27190 [Klebsiella pneumoniae subsp. pneumoniae]|nr:hypothetical protein [Klebsiella pneumoniae subsp. pneumoniae]